MRHALLPAVFSTLPLAAMAQEPLSWSEIFVSPDIVVQQLVHTGIGALRSQVDLRYGTLAVNLRGGRLDMSDVQAWPVLPHDPNGDCAIVADRMTIQGPNQNQVELIRARIQATGVTVPLSCLPPAARIAPQIAGLNEIDLPRLTVDLKFDIPSGQADIQAFTELANVVGLSLTADFAYLWARNAGADTPELVANLRSASLNVDNLGGWDLARSFLPPPFTDPAEAGQTVQAVLGQALSGITPGGPLNAAQEDFIASAAEAWPAFLANPRQLVIETGFDPVNDVALAVDLYQTDPTQLFTDLQPRMRIASRAARQSLPVDLLNAALGEDRATLSTQDRRRAGIALVTGDGAPRNLTAGAALLAGLADTGDGDAALTLARALADTDAPRAYGLALRAGALDQNGASALMDQLERGLDLAQILDLQSQARDDTAADVSALPAIRSGAIRRLSGQGVVRSYRDAAVLASLGKAAGDAASADVLDQIDAMMALRLPEEKAIWATVSEQISAEAIAIWTRENLPERLSQR